MRYCLALCLLGSLSLSCVAEEKHNTLAEKEIEEGWLLLFDGETTFGWVSPNGSKWTIHEGMLAPQKGKEGQLLTTASFGDYDLNFQIKTSADSKATLWVGLDPRAMKVQPKDKPERMSLGTRRAWTQVTMKVRGGRIVEGSFEALGGNVGEGFASADLLPRSKVGELMFTGSEMILRDIKLRPQNTTSLFNGKDLSGWKIHPGRKSKFSVTEAGELRIQDGNGDLQTEKQWSDFLFQVQCKTNGDRLNSGVFFRCIPDQYQQGYEAQIHNGFTEKPAKEYTVDVYDPKTHELKEKKKVKSRAMDYGTGAIYRRLPARKSVAKDKEWFTLTVVATGPHIATWVNGEQVVDWTDHRPMKENARQGCRLEKGAISFQGHDPTTDLLFKDIRIADLSGR